MKTGKKKAINGGRRDIDRVEINVMKCWLMRGAKVSISTNILLPTSQDKKRETMCYLVLTVF